MPLLAAALRQTFPAQSNIYLVDAFQKALLGGQLIFYAIGLLATVVWQANQDRENFFPWRSFLNLVSLVCVGICTLVIGYDPELNSIRKDILGPTSLIVFLVSVATYMALSVVSRLEVDLQKSLATSDAALTKAVRQSRGL